MRIHRTIDSEAIDMRDVAQVVIAAPTLSAKLIQVANSAIYQGSRNDETVQDAITRIGLEVAKSLTLSLSVECPFSTRSSESKALMRYCYEQSLLIG